MALIDNKITNSEVQEVQVTGKPKLLRGTVAENQGIFDAFASLIRNKFNSLIDDLVSAFVPATTGTSGLMSAEDKAKLDGIETGAEVNVLEGVRLNGVSLDISNKKVNIPLVSDNHTGIMSSADKVKLDGIEVGAEVNSIIGAKMDGTILEISNKRVIIPPVTPNNSGVAKPEHLTKIEGIPTIAYGYREVGRTISANGSVDVNITFSKTFSQMPSFTYSLFGTITVADKLVSIVTGRSTTGATVTFKNISDGQVSVPAILYQAIGV